jgi:ParB-like chromosome segregation protein Spo0J
MNDQDVNFATTSPAIIAGHRMEIIYKPISWFKEYARNPRRNDAAVDRMCASISKFGFAVAMLCRSTGEIVDGHLRFKGARKLDLTELPVVLCDYWTEGQVRAFRLMVNRSVAWAEWDEDLLGPELLDLKALDFDLSLTGFDSAELDRLLQADDAAGLTDEDAVPELPQTAISAPGDLWVLGNHKLLVGDATNQSDVAKLMVGDSADLIFTAGVQRGL